jgi:hypothetical protein
MRAPDPFAPIQLVVTLDRETFELLLEEAEASGLPAASRAAAKLLREALGTAAPEPAAEIVRLREARLRLLPPPDPSAD